jgi:endoplasmic reticulum chaperone BiP
VSTRFLYSLSPATDISKCSVGDAAKNAYHSNPENTVFDAKRLIGRKVDDPEIKRDQVHWPFQVVKKNDKPAIEVRYKGETRQFVSSMS